MYDIIERWLVVFLHVLYDIKSGFVCQLLVPIIKKNRFKMPAGFRLVEVCTLSGWSILLRECLMLVVIKDHTVYGCRVFRQ